MIPPWAEKYRPTTDETAPKVKRRKRDQALQDEANAVPIQKVLLDGWGIAVPDTLERSWKTNCPFGFEHVDGGVDKAMRVYPSNTAYCFSQHGMLTPVRLTQLQKDVSSRIAAKILAQRYGLGSADPYWVRAQKLILAHDDTAGVGSTATAAHALQTALQNLPGYEDRQFDTDVTKLMEASLEELGELQPVPGAIRQWFRVTLEQFTKALEEQI